MLQQYYKDFFAVCLAVGHSQHLSMTVEPNQHTESASEAVGQKEF